MGVVLMAVSSAVEPDETQTTPEPDWLNPHYADKSEWDPFGSGQEATYAPDRPSWDPYAPHGGGTPGLVSANPTGLAIRDDVLRYNKLYLQSGGSLTTSGTVNLGEPYTLWLHVGNWGSFVLYDRGREILSHDFIYPGWYRIDRYAEILVSHQYVFNVTGLSNEVSVSINPAGYSTTSSLVGRVVDQYGRGIPGATVQISSGEGGSFGTNANNLGYYGMDLPSGVYSMTAELSGYRFIPATARVWSGTVSVAGKIVGYPLYGTDPFAARMGWLEGKVVDKNGIGVPGARVRSDDGSSVVTDASGGYTMTLNPGWHTINAEAEGLLFRSVNVHIVSGRVTQPDLTGREILVLGGG
ncbi:MAG: carboxypeptidase-like regulatory domain-containing protein [Methanotrichaceae archaeon]